VGHLGKDVEPCSFSSEEAYSVSPPSPVVRKQGAVTVPHRSTYELLYVCSRLIEAPGTLNGGSGSTGAGVTRDGKRQSASHTFYGEPHPRLQASESPSPPLYEVE
jgi:hypothetical protein